MANTFCCLKHKSACAAREVVTSLGGVGAGLRAEMHFLVLLCRMGCMNLALSSC